MKLKYWYCQFNGFIKETALMAVFFSLLAALLFKTQALNSFLSIARITKSMKYFINIANGNMKDLVSMLWD